MYGFFSGSLPAGTYTFVMQGQQTNTSSSTCGAASDRTYIAAEIYN